MKVCKFSNGSILCPLHKNIYITFRSLIKEMSHSNIYNNKKPHSQQTFQTPTRSLQTSEMTQSEVYPEQSAVALSSVGTSYWLPVETNESRGSSCNRLESCQAAIGDSGLTAGYNYVIRCTHSHLNFSFINKLIKKKNKKLNKKWPVQAYETQPCDQITIRCSQKLFSIIKKALL